MLKMLYLIPAEKFGGAERQATVAVKNLPKYGIEAVPVFGPGKMMLEELKRYGINRYEFLPTLPDDPKHPLAFAETVKRWFYNIDCFKKSRSALESILKRDSYDLIYASRTFSFILTAFISRETRIPYIWRFGSNIIDPFQRFMMKRLIYWAAPLALVVNCRAMKESLQCDSRENISIIYHSIDTGRFNPSVKPMPLRDRLKIDGRTSLIGVSARPAPEKGLDFLIEVLKRFDPPYPDYRLVWAGESSWRGHFEKIFSKHPFSGKVSFLGHLPVIEEFYAACDLLILTSRPDSIETTPNSILEPMAMGKPVVATSVGGLPEILRDGQNGLLADYGDADAFSRKMIRLLTDAEYARNIGIEARRTIEENHNEEKNIKILSEEILRNFEKVKSRETHET